MNLTVLELVVSIILFTLLVSIIVINVSAIRENKPKSKSQNDSKLNADDDPITEKHPRYTGSEPPIPPMPPLPSLPGMRVYERHEYRSSSTSSVSVNGVEIESVIGASTAISIKNGKGTIKVSGGSIGGTARIRVGDKRYVIKVGPNEDREVKIE